MVKNFWGHDPLWRQIWPPGQPIREIKWKISKIASTCDAIFAFKTHTNPMVVGYLGTLWGTKNGFLGFFRWYDPPRCLYCSGFTGANGGFWRIWPRMCLQDQNLKIF